MAIIIPDNKIRNVKLTGDEVQMVLDVLIMQPHNFYEGYLEKIVKKLNDAFEVQHETN